jgi:hypothetical protein
VNYSIKNKGVAAMTSEIDEQFFVKQVLESIDTIYNTIPYQGQLTKKYSNRHHSQVLSKSYSVTRKRILSHVQIEQNSGQLRRKRAGLLSISENVATKKDIAAYKSEIESRPHLRRKMQSPSVCVKITINTGAQEKTKPLHSKKDIDVAIELARDMLFDINKEEKSSISTKKTIKEFIRDALCPSLLKTSNDVFEIAKVSTPTLLTLSLSGIISLPIQPVFFAAAAILLAGSSIAKICKDTHQPTPG